MIAPVPGAPFSPCMGEMQYLPGSSYCVPWDCFLLLKAQYNEPSQKMWESNSLPFGGTLII